MGRMLDDVTEDRTQLLAETKKLAKKLIRDAREAIEFHGGLPNPVVAAIIGSKMHLWPLYWKDEKERDALFAKLNKYFDDMNATSTIFTYQKGSSVVMAVEAPGLRRLSVLPFEVGERGAITWGKPRFTSRFSTPLHGPCLN